MGVYAGMRGIQRASSGITLLLLVCLNIDVDFLVLHCIIGSRDQWGFPPFFTPNDSPFAQGCARGL